MGLAWLALVGYVGLRFTTSSSPAESLADDTDEWARPVEERRPEFKSVSEQIIADTLDNLGVRWQYESELQLDGERFFPDFYLPEKDAYVEFWGMPDDFDYERRMRYKMARYHRAGVRFLSIYASHLWPSGTNSPPDKQRLRWILERKIEELQ